MSDLAMTLIGEEEGRERCVYTDSLGIQTIGLSANAKTDTTDSLGGNTELSAKRSKNSSEVRSLAYLGNLIISQCCIVMRGPPMNWRLIVSAVYRHVLQIAFLRIPSKIVNGVISWISIIVGTNLSIWRQSTKSQQHQAMNARRISFPVHVNTNGHTDRLATLLTQIWLQDSRRVSRIKPNRSYRSCIGSPIVRKSRNWMPSHV